MALIDYNNGTATISVNGGQPPFSYLLKQGGVAATHNGANFVNPIVSSNQSVVFGDASDLTGSYGMPSGAYTCEITDSNNCVVTTSEIVISQTEEATTTQATAATTLATAATTLATIPTTPATDATTLATDATTLASDATTLATDATTLASDATTLATDATTLPTFTCTQANFTMNDGITGTALSYSYAGVSADVNPSPQQSGNTEYTATIIVPATDPYGTPYSNAGASIECTDFAIGTDPTTLATDATTLATDATTLATDATTLATDATTLATTLAPVKGYYLHGGNQAYPFAQGEGLTANPTGTLYYDDGANAYASTTDLSVAMTYLMDLGTITGAGGYTIQEFDIAAGGITSMGTTDALQFPASTQAEFYYIILPDTEVDLTSVSPQHLVNGGIETNAIQRMPFTWNSNGYYIYKIGGGSQSGALTITFSDND